jgi:hypothetical protein
MFPICADAYIMKTMTTPVPDSAAPKPAPAPEAEAKKLPAPLLPPEKEGLTTQQKIWLVVAVIVALALLGLAIWAVIFWAGHPASAAIWRDIFIIFMALESFVIGVALIILVVQLAVLTNLLKHEIQPILESTNDTVNTVRGTALFVSENLTEPIIKLNSYVAALEKVTNTLGALFSLGRKK